VRLTGGDRNTPVPARFEVVPQIDTPALVVDLDQLQRNIDSMADATRAAGIALRPHAKTHKSSDIARLQLAAGAVGLTVATLGEAEIFAKAGFDDLFVAYPVWPSRSAVARLHALSERVRIRVGVDSDAGLSKLADVGVAVLIELDCGQHRSGIPPHDVVRLGRACERAGLEVSGVFTHAGHSYAGPEAVARAARDEVEAVAAAVCALERAGLEVTVASAGSTPTALLSATGPVNESRPGTYVFNDRQQLALGVCELDRVAAYVAATVVSNNVDGRFVIDAGSKALAGDHPPLLEGFGSLPGWDDAVVTALSEHHGTVREPASGGPRVGDTVAVVPNHICTVVNLFDRFVVVGGGELAGTWPVTARGR
jgi:D-serine deaminase-like pyridoxal phosphate-dependent protein